MPNSRDNARSSVIRRYLSDKQSTTSLSPYRGEPASSNTSVFQKIANKKHASYQHQKAGNLRVYHYKY
jgi:hypothetical protein